jgi:tetratricopeptide (TPR) repeat protein
MATYNKRGYKAPKPAEVNDVEPAEENFDGKSTTAEVFNTLDEGASKTEEWVEKNQKIIFGVVIVIAIATIGYLLYDKFLVTPKEEEAATEMFQAQQYFTEAVDAQSANDSLYNLSLNGGEGKLGFLGIIENYSGTDAANIAEYFAGMAYLNTGKYKEAVEHLENFNSEDEVLNAMARGATGDAFAQLKQNDDALEFYNKAISISDDSFTKPRFLLKAGQLALIMNKKAEALKYFTEIKEKYETTSQGVNIDAYIALAE